MYWLQFNSNGKKCLDSSGGKAEHFLRWPGIDANPEGMIVCHDVGVDWRPANAKGIAIPIGPAKPTIPILRKELAPHLGETTIRPHELTNDQILMPLVPTQKNRRHTTIADVKSLRIAVQHLLKTSVVRFDLRSHC